MEPIARELILSVTDPDAVSYAVKENGKLVEYETADNQKIGTVYCCRVSEYIKAYKACFCEVGEERRGYLNTDAYRAGQWLLCQVNGEAHEQKGMRLTDNVKLSGAYVVLLGSGTVGISGKIQAEHTRQRLKKLGEKLLLPYLESSVGVIFRTEAEQVTDDVIEAEFLALIQQGKGILKAFETAKQNGNPKMIYQPDWISKVLFRYPPSTVSSIYCDSPVKVHEIETKYPVFTGKVHLCKAPVMHTSGVATQLPSLLGRKVWLKCGGYLIFDKTEAMTVIDVNSGKTSGIRSARELARTVNFQAAEEIMRSMRLRSIGGMILCDMIDMEEADDRRELLDFMGKMANNDPALPKIHDITKLGIVEITRKRTKNAEYLDKRG